MPKGMYKRTPLNTRNQFSKPIDDTASVPVIVPNADDNEYKELDPFLTLSDKKKELVLILGDVSKESIQLTKEQIAKRLDVDNETLAKYMKDNIVLEAVSEYRKFHFRQRLEWLFQNDLLARYEGVTGKPLAKEDRQLIARMFSIDAMPAVSINLNIKDNQLKKIL